MFWERFYELCTKIGSRPNPVGKQLGIASSTITQWKQGSEPSKEMLVKIAEFFNVSIDYLIGNDTKAVQDPATDDQLKFALFGTTDIDDDILQDVIEIAKTLKERKKGKQ